MADKKKVGRPLKFKSAKELQKKINEYFESCFEERWYRDQKTGEWNPVYDRNGNIVRDQVRPFTITGLAVHLGTTRRTLLDYEEYDDDFAHTIKQAKARIEAYTEQQLYNSEARNMTGIIFNLKNNYGWQDKTEIDNNIANKDGKPFEMSNTVDLRKLSPQELMQLESILSKTNETSDA